MACNPAHAGGGAPCVQALPERRKLTGIFLSSVCIQYGWRKQLVGIRIRPSWSILPAAYLVSDKYKQRTADCHKIKAVRAALAFHGGKDDAELSVNEVCKISAAFTFRIFNKMHVIADAAAAHEAGGRERKSVAGIQRSINVVLHPDAAAAWCGARADGCLFPGFMDKGGNTAFIQYE